MEENLLDIKNYKLKLEMACLYYSVVFDGWLANKYRNKNEIFAIPYCEKYDMEFLQKKAQTSGYTFEEKTVRGLAVPKNERKVKIGEADWIIDWPDKNQKEYENYTKIQVPNECLTKLIEEKSRTRRVYEFKIWKAKKIEQK